MAPPSSCTFNTPIPNPPTPLSACSVPIGGSNSTFLDTCCNGHINPIRTYGSADDKDECYMFCTTDNWAAVKTCLEAQFQNAGKEGAGTAQKFGCFNEVESVGAQESGGMRRWTVQGWGGWAAVGVLVMGFVGGMV